jgi:hypothetical protein
MCGEDKTDHAESGVADDMYCEYFSFVCKYIFNIEISPVQALILHDMWNRKFPMLVGFHGVLANHLYCLYIAC